MTAVIASDHLNMHDFGMWYIAYAHDLNLDDQVMAESDYKKKNQVHHCLVDHDVNACTWKHLINQ